MEMTKNGQWHDPLLFETLHLSVLYLHISSYSLFVLLKGATKEEAFRIGKEIVEAVTADNPKPVKLKFEKVLSQLFTTTITIPVTLQVYLPCVLQTKKRYVGYAYESEEQKEPIFDAKGIETVRRDGCPAVVKVHHTQYLLIHMNTTTLTSSTILLLYCVII